MAKNVYGVFRTVRIAKPYSKQLINGRNGQFEQKMVMFVGASDRDYKHTVTDEAGNVSKERQSDFYTFKATGPIADLFNQYCSAMTQQADGSQKLVSRRLFIKGHDETYVKETMEQIQTPDGKIWNVPRKETRTITVVENIEFLDGDPTKRNANNAQVAQVAQAVAPAPQQAAQVAQVAQVVQTPVAPVANAGTVGEVSPF